MRPSEFLEIHWFAVTFIYLQDITHKIEDYYIFLSYDTFAVFIPQWQFRNCV